MNGKWPSDEAFATDDTDVTRVYERSDADELLGGYVGSIIAEVEEGAVEEQAITGVYRRVAGALLTRPRAHLSMSPAQRTALILLFKTTMRVRVEKRRRERDGELSAVRPAAHSPLPHAIFHLSLLVPSPTSTNNC